VRGRSRRTWHVEEGSRAILLYFEAPSDEAERLHPSKVVEACIESGAHGLLLDHGSLPPAFFDLSSRIAGELVHKVTLYDIRTAIVVPDLAVHSERFQEFAREANHSRQFRFFRTRSEAAEWLSTER
jgi:hypothetical protein